MTAAPPTFALASTLLILAPGPDSLLVLRDTLRHGRRAGWITATGTVSGLPAWAVAAAFGLSALFRPAAGRSGPLTHARAPCPQREGGDNRRWPAGETPAGGRGPAPAGSLRA
jgi:LysE type translocator